MNNKRILKQITKEDLWKGCMLASIAHAISVARYPDFSHEHSWDGNNYSLQDSMGMRGTITFHSPYCIAAFRDDHSMRCHRSKLQDAREYFRGSSSEIMRLAEGETLQYLLDDIDGKTLPVITSAFWSTEEGFFSRDSLDELLDNGGSIMERQIMEIDSAIELWREENEMSEKQIDLLTTIFKRKVANPDKALLLSNKEMEMIEDENIRGLEESKILFGEIGIYFE